MNSRRHSSRAVYFLKIASVFIMSAFAVAAGGCIVSVNCHNSMYSDKIELFAVHEKGDGIVVTLAGEDYYFGK
ncbi:MAG: hypothetical protein ACI4JJ_06670 [Huintestinicola sp.]